MKAVDIEEHHLGNIVLWMLGIFFKTFEVLDLCHLKWY